MLGHDDNHGEPGSGPFVYVDEEHLELVEKYTPKRCEGKIKTDWKIGDSFIPKKDFDLDQDDFDDVTGVVEPMVKLKDTEMSIIGITTEFGPMVMLDNQENYGWLAEWIDAVE